MQNALTLGRQARPRSIYLGRSFLIPAVTALVTVILVFAPIVPILYQALIDRPLYDAGHQITQANFIRLFTLPAFRAALVNSLLFAVGSTLIAQLLGICLAILLGRTDLPGRRFFGELMLWPLYLSSLVLAFGWFMVYGPAGYVTLMVKGWVGAEPWSLYSLGGMALIGGVSQAPLTLLYCLGSTALADSTLEDAARCCGAGAMRTLGLITLPMLMPAIVYSGALNFTIALETLSIPLIFGEPVGMRFFTTLIYAEGVSTARRDYGLVGAASTLLLAAVGLLVIFQIWLLRNSRRYVSVGGKAIRSRSLMLQGLKWPLFALVLVYALFSVVLPVGVLILRACVNFLSPLVPFWTLFTIDNFVEVFAFESSRRAITNTILLAVVGGAVATGYILLIALTVHRSDFPFRRSLEFVAMIPRALPGMIAGIGFFYAMMLFQPPEWVRNTILILLIAYAMRFIPTGFGAISPALIQISPELDRSARVIGADWWTVCRTILIGIVSPALVSCFALMFVHIVKEYSIAVFLFAPGSEVIGSTLLQFWVQGDMGRVAALCSVQIAITFGFVYAAKKALGVRIYG